MDNYGQSWAVITYQKSAKISKDLKNLEISNFQIEEFKNMYRTFQIFKSRNWLPINAHKRVLMYVFIGLNNNILQAIYSNMRHCPKIVFYKNRESMVNL